MGQGIYGDRGIRLGESRRAVLGMDRTGDHGGAARMSQGNRKSSIVNNKSDASGLDLDVWGGGAEPLVVVPQPGTAEPCILKVDGQCPDGCRACT